MSNALPWQSWLDKFRSTPLAFPLPPRILLTLSGPDAVRFLNGQTSNQMQNLRPETALRTCLLTIKGRLIAAPWAWLNEQGSPVLEVPAGLAETVTARLERYLIADDVEISSAPAPPAWHLTGPGWPDSLLSGGRMTPRFGQPGWDFAGDFSPSDLPAPAHLGTAEEAEALRVALGLPGDEAEIVAEVFPAEIGLDRTAVDFHKGCYLGQEVVSRLESVGQARRGLLRWTADQAIAPGAELTLLTPDAPPRAVGVITSSIHGEGGSFGLALVRTDLASPGSTLSASHAGGPALDITLHPIS